MSFAFHRKGKNTDAVNAEMQVFSANLNLTDVVIIVILLTGPTGG